MKKHKTYPSILNSCLLPLTFSILLAACSSLGHSSTQTLSHSPLPTLDKEAVWQLVEMSGRPVPQSSSLTLLFNPEAGTLRGQSTCNTYSADYQLSHFSGPSLESTATIKIKNLSHSDIQCTEAQMNSEQRYLSLLSRANQLSLSPDGWTLTLSSRGRTLLVFSLQ